MSKVTNKSRGDEAENQARAYLEGQGLRWVVSNYRLARGPKAKGAEIDLIMMDKDGTLVFVEVRKRSNHHHGGAAASITPGKQRRCIWAARHFLLAWQAQGKTLPPCRFDVVVFDGAQLTWLPSAFVEAT